MRTEMTQKIKNLSQDERHEIERKLREKLTSSPEWQQASVIGITLSYDLEWDTHEIIKQAWDEGKEVAVPKSIHETRQMEFYKIKSYDDVEKGYVGILEPKVNQAQPCSKSDIDFLVVPGRVYNKEGYRIGFGGGFYDRFLVDFDGHTVSQVWEGQLVDDIPTNQYDLPVEKLFVVSISG